MRWEELNARVLAAGAFLVISAFGLVASLVIATFLGLYWDVLSIFGTVLNAGSIYDALLNLVAWVLAILSIYLAYRCAKKVYMFVLLQEVSQEIAPDEFKE